MIYNSDEIITDIFDFEKVKVEINGVFKKVNYLQSYSNFWIKPLPDTSNVDDLKKRLHKFLESQAIPEIDSEPSEEKDYTLYGGNNIGDRFISIKASDDTQEILDLMGKEEYKMKYSRCLILTSDCEVFGYYTRIDN